MSWTKEPPKPESKRAWYWCRRWIEPDDRMTMRPEGHWFYIPIEMVLDPFRKKWIGYLGNGLQWCETEGEHWQCPKSTESIEWWDVPIVLPEEALK